ncbi:MAG TPA: hypothetical protein VFD92_25830 [Candidatus Binatia bacterium]|nr:hypothetical protein [Candidatus Binatia bacterium]
MLPVPGVVQPIRQRSEVEKAQDLANAIVGERPGGIRVGDGVAKRADRKVRSLRQECDLGTHG